MIILKNVALRRGSKVLLDNASVTLNPGEKVGLVGRNGAGKSSLFAVLNGSLHEDGGDVSIPAQWRMAQVAQDMPETEQTATDFVVEGDTTLLAARLEAYPEADQRPTLTGRPIAEEMVEVLAARDALYQQAAHHIIDAMQSPEAVVSQIVSALSLARAS